MYFTQLHLKRSFIMLWSILLLAVLVLGMVTYGESRHALAAGHAPSTTLLTIKGSGIKQTATFTVPSTWTITWTCKPTSFYGFNYNVIVYVYRANGTLADVAINAICSKTTTHGSTVEHIAGKVYLSINSEASWVIRVY